FTKRVRVSEVNGPRAGPREARVRLCRLPSQFTWDICICPDNIGFHSSSAGDRVRASRSQNRRFAGLCQIPRTAYRMVSESTRPRNRQYHCATEGEKSSADIRTLETVQRLDRRLSETTEGNVNLADSYPMAWLPPAWCSF